MIQETMKIAELFENYYELYARLQTNAQFMTEKQYKFMSNSLYDNFESEYSLLSLKEDIAYMQELTETKMKHGALVPHKFLWLKNRAMKITRKEMGLVLRDIFKSREQALIKNIAPRNENESEAPVVESTENVAKTTPEVTARTETAAQDDNNALSPPEGLSGLSTED